MYKFLCDCGHHWSETEVKDNNVLFKGRFCPSCDKIRNFTHTTSVIEWSYCYFREMTLEEQHNYKLGENYVQV